MVDPIRRFKPRLSPAGLLAGFAVSACLWGLIPTQALAQATPSLGGRPLDPSILNRDLFPKTDQGAPLLPSAPQAPTVDTGETDTQADEVVEEESPRFVLKEILISGVSVFKSELLEEKFSPWIDREVGYTELLQIAGEVTQLYKDHGYITSRAVLPPQEIENGSVTIHVIEGKVGDVKIEGNRHVREGYIAARIKQRSGEVFRLQTLQHDMLNLSTDPLLDRAHATLKTGTRPGTSDILLDITDHRPYHLSIGVDNMGRNGIGLWRTNITASHENLLGFGDNAVANMALASGTVAVFGQYKYPVNTRGWFVGGNYGFTHVNAGDTAVGVLMRDGFKIREITGNSHRFSAFTEMPLYRTPITRRWDVNGHVSLNFTDAMTYLDGVPLRQVQRDLKKIEPRVVVDKFPRIRTITSRVNAVEQDASGRWLLGGSMTNGFAALGGNEAFSRFNTEISRIQALPYGLIGVFRAEGQFSPNRLPFAEKMQVGGANSVRGYGEGHLIADSGYLFSAEVRYPLVFLPQKLRNQWQGLVFVEHGRVYATGDGPDSTLGRPGSLLGYGVGIRGRLTQYLNARLDLGLHTVRGDQQPDVRAHFSLQSQLF